MPPTALLVVAALGGPVASTTSAIGGGRVSAAVSAIGRGAVDDGAVDDGAVRRIEDAAATLPDADVVDGDRRPFDCGYGATNFGACVGCLLGLAGGITVGAAVQPLLLQLDVGEDGFSPAAAICLAIPLVGTAGGVAGGAALGSLWGWRFEGRARAGVAPPTARVDDGAVPW